MVKIGKLKLQSELARELKALIVNKKRERKIGDIYDFLKQKDQTLFDLIRKEKELYQGHIRSNKQSNPNNRAEIHRGELGIRYDLFAKGKLKFGGQEIRLIHQEFSTIKIRNAESPGGKIDLLGCNPSNGRLLVIELKGENSNCTLIEAIIQAVIYRAQIAMMAKKDVLNFDECPKEIKEFLMEKKRWAYGAVVLAPEKWKAFKNELTFAKELLSRDIGPLSVIAVGSLIKNGTGYDTKMEIGPISWEYLD
jgi:hypothetical protein